MRGASQLTSIKFIWDLAFEPGGVVQQAISGLGRFGRPAKSWSPAGGVLAHDETILSDGLVLFDQFPVGILG
jgi:hypothetical protein